MTGMLWGAERTPEGTALGKGSSEPGVRSRMLGAWACGSEGGGAGGRDPGVWSGESRVLGSMRAGAVL